MKGSNNMKKEDCIFCKLANGDIPTNSLYEDDIVKVIFDLGPASQGHVLVIPKQHYDNIYSIDEDTAGHIFKVVSKIAKVLNKALDCEGMNILQNNGAIAGQTVFHFHMHIIPRYTNDSVKITWKPGETDSAQIQNIIDKVNKEWN